MRIAVRSTSHQALSRRPGHIARSLANDLLGNLGDPTSDSYVLSFLKSAGHASQNLVTAELEPPVELETVPLPAAGFLLLGALGGLGVLARGKRSTA